MTDQDEPLKAGVIGLPIAHSISPRFQQAGFAALNLNVRYQAYEISPEALPAFLATMRHGGWLGCNVTIPHKRAAYESVDTLTDEAEAIGAVNTILVQEGRLLGHNTDAEGFMRALVEEAHFDVRGRDAVLLGAGGAALAVAIGLARGGVRRLWIANRSAERAQALAQRILGRGMSVQVEAIPLKTEALRLPMSDASLLVNSTSVGMSGGSASHDLPLALELLSAHLLVYDLVYNPARTPLLEAAKRVGARTLEGLPMLIYQGAASLEKWTGRPAPITIMMEAGRRALAERTRH